LADAAVVFEELAKYGPLGLFILSFLNNVIPGLPAFYLTVVTTYSALIEEPLALYAGILLSGLGAGLGKVVLFVASGAIVSRVGRARRKRQLASSLLAGGGAKLSIAVAVFLIASLPLPDDVIYIPLAAAGFSLPAFAIAVIAGKIVLVMFAYAVGRVYKNVIDVLVGDIAVEAVNGSIRGLAILVGGSIAASIAVTLLLLSLDWETIYTAYIEKGPKEAFKTLAREAVDLVTLRKFKSAARNARNRGAQWRG